MTIGAGGSHTSRIDIMFRLSVFLVYVAFHLMTADTERLGIRHLNSRIKPRPKNDPKSEKTGKGDKAGSAGQSQILFLSMGETLSSSKDWQWALVFTPEASLDEWSNLLVY
jgi:hypothetical protein